jgi:large subunit ribosomal protein L19
VNLIDVVNADHKNPNVTKLPKFKTGDTVAVYVLLKDDAGKTRTQIFQGVCIAQNAVGDINGSFRVRKVSSGMGVERVFPYHSKVVEKVEVLQRGKSRRSKLYYLRDRSGKAARISIDYSASKADKSE